MDRFLLRLLRLSDATPGERAATLWTGLAFFCVLFAYYLLRPLRENVSFAFPEEHMVWLFTTSFVMTTLLNQPYTALVRRLPSRRFVPYALHFFAASFVVLAAVLAGGSTQLGKLDWASWRGAGFAFFYSWVTAFSVCGVTLIWVHAAEHFSTQQGKRLFGFVSIGGTLGAIAGSWLAGRMKGTGYGPALLVAAVSIELGVLLWWLSLPACRALLAARAAVETAAAPAAARPRVTFLRGLQRVAADPYLRGIALFVLLSSVTATTFYYQRAALVREQLFTDEARKAVEASINFWQNTLCLLVQLFLTSRALLLLGISAVLCVMPSISLLGLGAFGLWPVIGVYAAVEVLRRMLQFAFDKPAREVLYTPLDQQGKYVSKAVIDTAVMRLGDVVGAVANHFVFRLQGGLGVFATTAPLVAVWGGIGWWLGRRCGRGGVGKC